MQTSAPPPPAKMLKEWLTRDLGSTGAGSAGNIKSPRAAEKVCAEFSRANDVTAALHLAATLALTALSLYGIHYGFVWAYVLMGLTFIRLFVLYHDMAHNRCVHTPCRAKIRGWTVWFVTRVGGGWLCPFLCP